MSPHSFQRLVHVQRFWSRLSSPAQTSMRRAGVLFEDSVACRKEEKRERSRWNYRRSTTRDGIGEQVTICIIHNLRGLL